MRRFDLDIGNGRTASLDVYKGDENDTYRLAETFVRKFHLPHENIPTISEWLSNVLPSGGIDGDIHIPKQYDEGKQKVHVDRELTRRENGYDGRHNPIVRARLRNTQSIRDTDSVTLQGIEGATKSLSGALPSSSSSSSSSSPKPHLNFRNTTSPLDQDFDASPSISSSSTSPASFFPQRPSHPL